ncbi:tetratricopeptide repeat protein 39C-like [Selaginella moellendorffii]|uniref:tetratricopeptide repeat protein 39C-like n=1 Tax=Selaginella moellendorffii TaxID=88036 RepID=UPI000D1CF3F0|nr:tetratricopeptide repeat protein 39C-like [Selaginella moellendorffii]|eukprot:XP_024530220.1 tetratricopeptide repeat protein 39C-like [Selaginella moellendorffii]
MSSSSGDRIDNARLDIKQLDALGNDQRMVLDTRKGIQEDYELSSLRIGLEFGIGAFNLVVSLIPASFQKATEVMGLPGDRNKGLRLLQKAAATNHPRAPISFVMLLQYHTVIMGLLPYGDQHGKEAKQLLDKVQAQWKNGSIFRIMLSRYERYEGMLSKSLDTLVRNSKTDPYDISNRGCNQRLRNFMIDELGWCYLLQGEFDKAAEQFGKLFKDTVWFKPFYACLQAACLWEAGDKQHEAASSVLRELPQLVAGKKQTGPLEQYGLRMANEFVASSQAPLFPALELAAVYNGFQHMDKPSLERHMDAIEDVQKKPQQSGEGTSKAGGHGTFEIRWNNTSKLLCRFLLGHCHKALGDKHKAQDCFRHVVKNSENVPGNFVPYSCYELAALLLQDDINSQEGLSLLDKAVAFPPHEFQPRLKFVVSEMTKIYRPLNK